MTTELQTTAKVNNSANFPIVCFITINVINTTLRFGGGGAGSAPFCRLDSKHDVTNLMDCDRYVCGPQQTNIL
jgi:hypothetical protein